MAKCLRHKRIFAWKSPFDKLINTQLAALQTLLKSEPGQELLMDSFSEDCQQSGERGGVAIHADICGKDVI